MARTKQERSDWKKPTINRGIVHDIPLSHSQNFIKSNELIERLVQKADLSKDDFVVEIGPGKGKITRVLAKYVGTLLAVEKDTELYQYSLDNNPLPNVRFYNEDFIKFNLPWDRAYKVFSNIPFDQSSDILRKLLDNRHPPTSSHLILQKEAAERYMGSVKESQTSIFYKAFFDFTIVHQFKSTDFTPVPKVIPVLLKIELIPKPSIAVGDKELYRSFLVYCFNQWSKDIANALDAIFTYPQIKRLSIDNKFKLSAKPTELTLKQWIAIFSYFRSSTTPEKRTLIEKFQGKYKRALKRGRTQSAPLEREPR